MRDLSVVIPVKDEPHHIVNNLKLILESHGAEVIIVDDGSDVPNSNAICHHTNRGYGAAIMTGINASTRKWVMTLDGDGQHTAVQASKLYQAFNLMEDVDMLIGSRRLKYESFIRVLGRKTLNTIASFFAGYYFQDLNSGMRIFNRELAVGYFPILCKEFSFTTSITMSMKCDNYTVETFPIKVEERESGKSRVKLVRHGFITLWYILKIGFALRTRMIRKHLRKLRGL